MAIYKSDIVDINLESGSIHRSYLNHTIGSGDNSANRFGVRTFRNGLSEDLSGASCQAIFMNAAGTNIALTSYGTVSGNEAYVTLPQACYNVEGQFTLAIKLVKSGETVTTRIVDGVVCNTGTTGAVAPTSSVPTYQEILDTYAAMTAATSAANTAIAETFDATKAYPAGKYVINSGALYRLTADHAANVTWANTSKVATNLGDETSSLKSAIDELAVYPSILSNTFTGEIIDRYDDLTSESLHKEVNKFPVIKNTKIIFSAIKGKTVSNTSPVVSGIEITGKNLFDPSTAQATNALNLVKTNRFVEANGNTGKTYSWLYALVSLAAGNYVLSFKTESSDSYVPFISVYSSSGSLIKNNCRADSINTFTLDAATTIELRMVIQNGTSSDRLVRFSDVQLETGTLPTSFSPYFTKKTIHIPSTTVGENEAIITIKEQFGKYKIVKGTTALADNLSLEDISADNNGGIISVINTNSATVQPDVEMLVFTNQVGYITPQMFGAAGDGVSDDTGAMVNAFDAKMRLYIPSGTYIVNQSLNVYNDVKSEYDAVIKAGSRIDELIKISPDGSAEDSIIGIDVELNIDGDDTAVTGVALYYIRQSNLKFRISNFLLYGFHYGKVTHGNNENRISLYVNNCPTGMLCDGNDSIFDRVIMIDCQNAVELRTHFICNEFHAWLTDENLYQSSIGIRITETGTSFQITDFRQDQIKYGIYLNNDHASVSGVVTNYRHAHFGISDESKIYHVFGNTDKYSTITIINLNGGRNLAAAYYDYYPKVIFKLLAMNDSTLAEAYIYDNANELPNEGVFTCHDTTNLPDGLEEETIYCSCNSIENLQIIYKRTGRVYFRRRYSYQNGWDGWRYIDSTSVS